MTNNPLTLFCLVDGESTSSAFPVKISPEDSIGDLKELIKTKKTNDFQDVDADKLTLWRVSISVAHDNNDDNDDDDEDLPILLDNVLKNDKKRLKAVTQKVTDIFGYGPAENTIHIIVQRPPPATPIQLRIVSQDHIEKELTLVLEGVTHHHVTEPVDPKDVETSQREMLGPFYKRPLPYHETATDTSLVMLGLELDKQARTSDGETLHSIVVGDVGRYTDHRVVAMVAPSGSGKTATVVDLASKHFVIYCVCCIPSPTISPGFKDPNFIMLAEDVESMYRTVIHRNQGTSQDTKAIDSEVKTLVGQRVQLEFLARLLFLQLLLQSKPDLKPQQFFREQTTSGASTIGELVYKLREYDNHTIHAFLDKVQTKLRSLLASRRLGLVIALDEAQVAVTGILSDKLISPSALLKNKNDLFDSKKPFWCITVIAGVQTHLENVVLLPKAYLDNDGFIKIDGLKVSPVLWADTKTELTYGQKRDYLRIAESGYRMAGKIQKDQGCSICGDVITWRTVGTSLRKPGLPIAADIKETYGVADRNVSELAKLPDLQDLINELLSDRCCASCDTKLTRDNAVFRVRRSIRDSRDNPLDLTGRCKTCKCVADVDFSRQVRSWAYLKREKRPGDYESLEKAMMAYVTTLARGFCVGSPAFDPEEFVVLRDEAAWWHVYDAIAYSVIEPSRSGETFFMI
ncbi:hypothetical protein BGZ96_002685 [Linnemannia gamsii]|uniref:Crinkler effector protein N-terminal domain-containing protein n=1 Tax=Linnemannia gamsii TaxID=64522 RepID=A0ABQ7JKA4_9FUNG|nr:hypothetical protein BGZ96_002685 [Linnemannia gamsii]